MRRFLDIGLAMVVATIIHVDWHFARPTHHRLSLGWNQHWLFAAIAFGLVGWTVARIWAANAWRHGGIIAALGMVIAQVIEPVAEVAFYAHRLGYPNEAARWTAFVACLAAGLPAYCMALWLCRPRHVFFSSELLSRVRPASDQP
jgi:hypothetical protein